MLICFFDSEGIVHTEFVPQGHTVNQFYYRGILERLRKRVVRVRPSIADNWMLHHDKAPCHTAISVIEFLAKITFLLFHSPHTPLVLCKRLVTRNKVDDLRVTEKAAFGKSVTKYKG